MLLNPIHFYGEPIEVEFDEPPVMEKKPPCPDRFIWQEETRAITAVLSEWTDFERRGGMARNMRPSNLLKTTKRGSWGVGRFFFRVRTESGRVFDLYYDRKPKDADDRKGSWILYRELAENDEE